MLHLRRVVEKIWGWFRSWKSQPQNAIDPERVDKLDLRHWGQLDPVAEKMHAIGPDCWIENTSTTVVVLESPLLKVVIVPAGCRIKIKSPVLEPYRDGLALKMREWDALFVAQSMIEEYNRGIMMDRLTVEETKTVQLPFPRRALGVVEHEIGLRAYR